MKGKLIVFEGLDGSGKETQTSLLEKRLNEFGIKAIRINFPNYESKYSLFIKDYLSGKFTDISPYLASVFFSLDRVGAYETKIKKFIDEGYIVVCDRYVYSNVIYHGSKLTSLKEKEEFFDWILDFEYNKCNLPKEEVTFFMDIPIDLSLSLIKGRNSGDIHEKNESFLRMCYENCKYVAEKYNFVNINCTQDGKLLPIDKINDIIFDYVLKILNYKGK